MSTEAVEHAAVVTAEETKETAHDVQYEDEEAGKAVIKFECL